MPHLRIRKVHLATHQRFIQRVRRSEDDPKLKRVSRDEVGDRTPLEPDHDDPDTRVCVERDPPLQVYCGYKAIQYNTIY